MNIKNLRFENTADESEGVPSSPISQLLKVEVDRVLTLERK